MPFIGRDWRSPGEAWVKTESLGWQRMKIIESQLHAPLCHQNPACSWPPKSAFGSHMISHCRNVSQHERTIGSQRSGSFRGSLSSESGSDGSSRSNSASPSPTESPEKMSASNHNVSSPGASVSHHLHPIVISSPYGQYSCCAHHYHYYEQSKSYSGDNNLAGRPPNAHTPTISRSLSPELNKTTTASSPLSSNSNNGGQKFRHNNSVSDFRSSTSTSFATTTSEQSDQQPSVTSSPLLSTPPLAASADSRASANLTSDERSNTISPPMILKNGSKLEDSECHTLGQYEHHQQAEAFSNFHDKRSSGFVLMNGTCCCTTSGPMMSQDFNSPQQNQQGNKTSPKTAPHCRISVRTREVAMYNTISEAFYRLDFCNAIHDIRRFNYICKLLHLLITQNLTSLSGCATKVLFTMLEQVAWEVSNNKRNIHVLRNLLNELRQMIQKYYCWGRPIGSSVLWQQHFDTIERISQIVDGIELSPPKSSATQMKFDNLPVEMIREILLRLNDYRDLVNSAQASPVMQSMINSQYIWQRLCRYHFTEQQFRVAFNNRDIPLVKKNCPNQRANVKYSKTSSADGRGSHRTPIECSKSKAGCQNQASSSNSCSGSNATTGRRNSRALRSANSGRPDPTSSASCVVGQTSRELNSDSAPSRDADQPSKGQSSSSSSSSPTSISSSNHQVQNGRSIAVGNPLNPNRSNQEIHWERVFHQLRKRYDLKEEYADCLLLCRHCRCLFWKSFGHPCIVNEEDQVAGEQQQQQQRSSSTQNLHSSGSNSQQSHQQRPFGFGGHINESHGNSSHQQPQVGPSVALLSRNFDNQVQGNGAENRSLSQAQRRDPLVNGSAARRPQLGANIRSPLRELHDRANNNQAPEIQRNNHNADNNDSHVRGLRRNESLVPKHVTISPQAFLKFFSL